METQELRVSEDLQDNKEPKETRGRVQRGCQDWLGRQESLVIGVPVGLLGALDSRGTGASQVSLDHKVTGGREDLLAWQRRGGRLDSQALQGLQA